MKSVAHVVPGEQFLTEDLFVAIKKSVAEPRGAG
jgi:hypothetical protein